MHHAERTNAMRNVRVAKLALFVAIMGMIPPSIGHTQLMVDLSRITCADYLALPPERARVLAAWLSGWFNQKTGYVWVDLDAYARNVTNVTQWCASYPDQLVMTGLQRATAK
jgi:hypothetical protein